MKTSLGFIGGGRITGIFLQGFKNKSVTFNSIKVYDPNPEKWDALKKSFPQIEKAEYPAEAAASQVVIIAVHPPVVMETLDKIAKAVTGNTVVVSLAPKITIEKLNSKLNTTNIVRMIPNATSYINKGYNPMAFHQAIAKKNRKQIKKLFKPLGKTFLTEEHKLESYAVVSGMLPTYFFFQWQELEAIAQKTGLSQEEAEKAIRSTLRRAIRLYYKSGLSPEEAMDLIPVKPILDHEDDIRKFFNIKLLELFEKIKA